MVVVAALHAEAHGALVVTTLAYDTEAILLSRRALVADGERDSVDVELIPNLPHHAVRAHERALDFNLLLARAAARVAMDARGPIAALVAEVPVAAQAVVRICIVKPVASVALHPQRDACNVPPPFGGC